MFESFCYFRKDLHLLFFTLVKSEWCLDCFHILSLTFHKAATSSHDRQQLVSFALLSFFFDSHQGCGLQIKHGAYGMSYVMALGYETHEYQWCFIFTDVQPWMTYIIWQAQWRWGLSLNNDIFFKFTTTILFTVYVLHYQYIFNKLFHCDKCLEQWWVKLIEHVILWFTFSWIKHMNDLAVRLLK